MQTRIVAVPLFASLLAGLVIMSGGGAARGDECLSNPKGPTPAGGHWYYHLDRATKRTCWFLKDESAASAKDAAAVSDARAPDAPAAATEATPPDQAVAPSNADARAEITAPRARKDAAAKPKPAAAKPVALKADAAPETTKAGADAAVGEGTGEHAHLFKVSDAEAPADGAAPAPTAPSSATPSVVPGAPPTVLPSVIPDTTPGAAAPVSEAPREGATAQVVAAAPAPAAREPVAIGALRMFLGLALIGAGLSVMLACLVFHLMYGTITFPQQTEAGQLTDLL